MYTSWTKGFTEEQEKDWMHNVSSAQAFIKRLKELIKDKHEALDKEIKSSKTYHLPAWSEFQADRLGESRAYEGILNLLEDATIR